MQTPDHAKAHAQPQPNPPTTLIAQLYEQHFCVAPHRETLSALNNTGALVEFSGQVRQTGDIQKVIALEIDYYAPLTQPAMTELLVQASQRWSLNGIGICHRVGRVNLGELIVWVGAASAHRQAAFAAASFVMDRLKTDVPFWKKEINAQGKAHWVKQKNSDRLSSAAHS